MKNMVSKGALCIMAAGLAACASDVGSDSQAEDERINSVNQAEVVSVTAGTCPAPFFAQTTSVKYGQELLITNPNVVDDKCRTIFNSPDPSCVGNTANNKWSFWYLATQMAGTNNVSRLVLKWLESFEAANVVVNGQTLESRPKIRSLIIDPWRAVSGCTQGLKYDDVGGSCTLDPRAAPFRLLSIVNRADLRAGGPGTVNQYGQISSGGDAGEGRFIFGFTKVPSIPSDINNIQAAVAIPEATVIFEYKIPTATRSAQTWAQDWHALGSFTAFNASYSNALQTITERFVRSGVMPAGTPNNSSAINHVRSDERDFDTHTIISQKVWSMREFTLQCLPNTPCGTNDKFIVNSTTSQTPFNGMNQTATLDSFLTTSQSSILLGAHSVPLALLGGDSRSPGGIAAINSQWNMTDQNAYGTPAVCTARRLYAFSTCNGCHYVETDNTGNLHVKNRDVGNSSVLSSFLIDASVVPVGNDPCEADPDAVKYNESLRRKCELMALVAGTAGPVSTGVGRIH